MKSNPLNFRNYYLNEGNLFPYHQKELCPNQPCFAAQSNCRCDCNLGICQQMLDVIWFTWVTVAMSIRSVDHHHFGSLWVVFFVCRVWVWAQGCKRVGFHGLHSALPRVATICGWLGTPPHPGPFVFWLFPLFSLDRLVFSQGVCYPSIN